MESRDPNPASSFPGSDWHRRLFELAPDALLVTRLRDGHIVDMNSRFLETMGYSREELIGRTPLDLGSWVVPEDREVLMTLLREGRGLCSGFETTMRNKQGCEIPVLMSARVTEIDGETYVVSQSREDSERRRIKKALQESEKKSQGEKLKEMEYPVLKKDGTRFPALIVSAPILRENRPIGIRGVVTDITGLRKVEEELKASEEKYRLVVENANEAIFIAQEGLLKLVNPKALEITGYDRETLQTKPFSELIHPEDRAMVVDRHLRRARGEDLLSVYSFRIVDREGQAKWVEVNAVRLDWEGRPATLNFLSDITDRRSAEEALRESEERARLIFNTVPDSVTITRVEDGGYILVNDYFCRLTGFSREETIGRTVSDLNVFVNVQDRERFIREMREKGEITNFEIQYRKKDGSLFTTLLSARPIRYAGEDCLVAVVTDITNRKQMEEALRKSEERYRLLVDNANEAILVIQGGMITFVNPRAIKIMNLEERALTPQPFLDFIHPEDRETVLQRYQERLSGEVPPARYSFRLVDQEGKILWVEINAVQIAWEGEPAALVFLTDITEKKQLEMQFLQSQKMEAVGRLAGGVAHDFNNLLTSILGHSDLMMMRLRPGDPLVGDIKEIIKAANRATDLTRQLLAFSRKQVMQPRILNLNGIISDMKKMLKRLIGEDIILETLLAPDLGQVLVDPGQIDQVIMNLVVNARDAMPKGGTLTIETGNALLDEVQVRSYMGAKPGAYVLLSVKDRGSGMSEEIQSHIFEPFFTTKELGKGTGLGLSTVYGIVKQSNGYIWVDSRPGQGTAFKIFLPQQEGKAESDVKPERGKVSLRGGETILLAEDNELVRGLTRSVLEHFGYQVLETEDGEEAGRMSKGYEGPIHLLLTDVVMPGLSGRVLAEQLQLSRPGIKILFMSGYSEEAVLLQGMQVLGAHFLQKPFTPEELGLRVREILDSA